MTLPVSMDLVIGGFPFVAKTDDVLWIKELVADALSKTPFKTTALCEDIHEKTFERMFSYTLLSKPVVWTGVSFPGGLLGPIFEMVRSYPKTSLAQALLKGGLFFMCTTVNGGPPARTVFGWDMIQTRHEVKRMVDCARLALSGKEVEAE
jgi:hypothetical protein